MQPVLTAAAMRRADEYTIREYGIPGFTLMESAGRGTAEHIVRRVGSCVTAAVYCGKGNNGGDGFVIARYLHGWGATVRVVYVGRPEEMTGDAEAQFRLLRKTANRDGGERLSLIPYDEAAALPSADVHVDALLGTGLTSELREPVHSLVVRLNDAPGYKVAVDVPTGLHSDLGVPLGAAFRADLTCTMGALKSGLCLHSGPEYAGEREVVDIGIPHFVLRDEVDRGEAGSAALSSDELVRAWMPARGSDANKYSVGLALVAAGSRGMTGAPVMASTAAARAGAGYVICACDYRIQEVLAVKTTEITTVALPASESGIDPEASIEVLSSRLEKANAVLVGCGLGRAENTQAFVRRLLEHVEAPIVVDADGLYALGGRMELIRRRARGRWILTPHMGEFKRLAGDDLGGLDFGLDDRVRLAQHFARAWGCVLLLKGLPSVTAAPDGRAWINATGGPALASAGTGDVLAGLCVGLLAQGMPPERAAVAALHLGGAAADRYVSERSARSMQAMDLLEELPHVMAERFDL